MKRLYTYNSLIALVFLIITTTAIAEVPNTINYQGRLVDDAGDPVDDVVLIKFNIYDSETGGSELWSSGYQMLQISDGLFTYELGSNVALPDDLFTGDDSRYLGITVDTDAEQEPRIQFIAVPYSLHSKVADSLINKDFVRRTGDTISGHIYFDNDGLGKETEILVYNDASIMNFYQEGAKRIALESDFGTMILNQQDGNHAVWLSGGEDEEYDGGSIGLYDADGIRQIKLDGAGSGDNSVILPDDAIHAAEILNEPGIASAVYPWLVTLVAMGEGAGMSDVVVDSITIPAPGYIYVSGTCHISLWGTQSEQSAIVQIDEEAGGGVLVGKTAILELDSALSTGRNYVPVFTEDIFYKSAAGTYTFRLEGRRINGVSAAAGNARLTMFYFPTAYGSVASVVSASDAANFDNTTLVESGDENSYDQPTETMYKVDLRELELKAKQKRIEALEAELELEKARRENK